MDAKEVVQRIWFGVKSTHDSPRFYFHSVRFFPLFQSRRPVSFPVVYFFFPPVRRQMRPAAVAQARSGISCRVRASMGTAVRATGQCAFNFQVKSRHFKKILN